jgi:catechol 2,3-dioxygenase
MMTGNIVLPAATTIGAVALDVDGLDGSLAFYHETLGMQYLGEKKGAHLLGAGETPLLRLYHRPDAPPPPPRATGLYHFALLLPSRRDLAAILWRLAARNTPFQGFSDHLVSEAIYLADPEGNGIELYRDRPRDEWQYVDGTLQISTLPLDTDSLLAEATEPAPEMAPGTTVGHVHLQVGDLGHAVYFYRDVVGFEVVTRYGPSAAFLSAGGYHHHLGLNTWAGVGAPPPPPGSRGLRWFEVAVPDPEALAALLERATAAGYPAAQAGDAHLIAEPAGAQLRLTTASS